MFELDITKQSNNLKIINTRMQVKTGPIKESLSLPSRVPPTNKSMSSTSS